MNTLGGGIMVENVFMEQNQFPEKPVEWMNPKTYEKVNDEIRNWPWWKKAVYNELFAI